MRRALATLALLLAPGCLQTANLQAPQVLQGGEVAVGGGMTEAGTLFVPNAEAQVQVGLGGGNDVSARGAWTPGIYTGALQLRHQVPVDRTSALIVSAGVDYQNIDIPSPPSQVGKDLQHTGLSRFVYRLEGVEASFLRMPLALIKVWPVDRWSFFLGLKGWVAHENDVDGHFGYLFGGALTMGFGCRLGKNVEWVLTSDLGYQGTPDPVSMPDLPLWETGTGLVLHFNGPSLDKRGAPILEP